MLEIYLIVGFCLFYLVTVWLLDQQTKQKIWLVTFILAFLTTSLSITLIHGGQENVMMTANEINWYYFIYLFGMISLALAVINAWIYRKALGRILTAKKDDED